MIHILQQSLRQSRLRRVIRGCVVERQVATMTRHTVSLWEKNHLTDSTPARRRVRCRDGQHRQLGQDPA
jgi:hypothetical protein